MKSMIFISLLIIVLCTYPSLQCNCNNKCNRCCNSGEFRLVPLYELFHTNTKTYFYTVSLRELNYAVKNRGYIRRDIIGLVSISSTDCNKRKSLVPVSRSFNSDNSDYLYQFKRDDEYDRKKTKYTPEGIVFYGSANEQPCDATLPLYRFWNGKNHIYATDYEEGKKRAGPNCKSEGIIISYIWPTPNTTPTTTPATTTRTTAATTRDPLENPGNCTVALTKLFRLYRNSSDSYLYTTSYDEAVFAYNNRTYDPQVSPGYVAPEPPTCRCNLKPVYRVDKSEPKEDHLFTTSEAEAIDAVSKLGYTDKGIAFYCADKIDDCGARLAYHRYKRANSIENHFYTVDLEEGKRIVTNSGGKDEGILCYIWLN